MITDTAYLNLIKQKKEIELKELKYDKSTKMKTTNSQTATHRKKSHTCYTCMSKFSTMEDLEVHRYIHSDSDAEDDLFIENYYLSNIYEGNIYAVTNSATDKKNCTSKNEADKNKSNSEETEPNEHIIDDKINTKDTQDISNTTGIIHNPTDIPNTESNIKENIEVNKITGEDINKRIFRANCSTCGISFRTIGEFNSHNSKKSCKFYCSTCHLKFSCTTVFFAHLLNHVKSQITSHKCSLCNLTFHSLNRMKRHERKVHKTRISIEYENTDNRTTTNKNTKKNEKVNTFTCNLCYDIFNNKKDLKNHKDFHKELKTTLTKIDMTKADNDVELVEDATNKHKISATFRRASSSSSPKVENINKKTQKIVIIPVPPEDNSLELKKTGPFSFAVNYKDADLVPQIVKDSFLQPTLEPVSSSESNKEVSTLPQKGPSPYNVTHSKPTAQFVEHTNTVQLIPVAVNQLNYLPDISIVSNCVKNPELMSPIVAKPTTVSSVSSNISASETRVQTSFLQFSKNNLSGGVITVSSSPKKLTETKNTDKSNSQRNVNETRQRIELDLKKDTLKSFGIYFEDPIVINDSDTEEEESLEAEKKFIAKCDSCRKEFYENDAVIQHSRQRRSCNECREKFCLAQQLRKHYWNQHKKIYCCKCHFLAKSVKEYEKHIQTGCPTYESVLSEIIQTQHEKK